jgi:HPt (histidine-containing phosphotransfer) domain-containing protein
VTLFKSLLGRMLTEFTDLARPDCTALGEEAVRSKLAARAHKLKGGAGMLGAKRIMKLAGAAEETLLKDRSHGAMEKSLQQLALALTALREEAQPYLEHPPARQAQAAIAADPRPPNTAQIDELCTLLEAHDLLAIDRFGAAAPGLRGALHSVRFASLSEAIDNLDFAHAAELLRGAPPAAFGPAAS